MDARNPSGAKSARERLSAALADVEGLGQRIKAGMNGFFEKRKSFEQELRQQMSDKDKRIRELETSLAQKDKELSAAQSEIAQMASQADDLAAKIRALSEEVEELIASFDR